jgi:hypothetical protein
MLNVGVTSRDSAVGIATGYGLDDQRIGVREPVSKSEDIPVTGHGGP